MKQLLHRSSTTLTDQSFTGTVNVGDIVVQDTANSWKRRTTEISGLALVVATTSAGIVVTTHGHAALAGAVAGTTYYLPASGFTLSTTASAYPYGVGKKADVNEDIGIEIFANKIIQDLYVDNTLYVDLTYGNNTTGLRERADRPFATVAAAVTASQANDTIVLRNGSYAIGTITLPHSLNFIAENGVVISGGALVMGGNTVKWRGGKITSSDLFVYDTNCVFDIEIDSFEQIGVAPRVLCYSTVTTGINNVRGSLRGKKAITDHPLSGGIIFRFGGLSNSNISVEFDDLIGGWAFIRCSNSSIMSDNIDIVGRVNSFIINQASVGALYRDVQGVRNSRIFIDCKNARHDVYIPASGGGNGVLFYANSTLQTYNNRYQFYVGNADVSQFMSFPKTESDIIIIDGDKISGKTSSQSLIYAGLDGSSIGGTSATKIILNTREIYGNASISGTYPGSGYSVINTPISSLGAVDREINSKIIQSVNTECIGIDNQNPGTNANLYPSNFVINGTKFYRNNIPVSGFPAIGSSYPGVIYFDLGNPLYANVLNISLHNGVVLQSAGIQDCIRGINHPLGQVNLYLNDDIVAYGQIGGDVATTYLYQPTKTITASGTYTVLDNENDLYYDLTLGNLTFVLPDPNKYINREIQLKVTATHATNTITVDPAGTAQIENATTFVLPGTSTTLVNYVFKSQSGKWWIK